MQEVHITEPGPVLNEKGVITPGFSEKSISVYERKAIKAPFYRIKEWDWYQVNNGQWALQFTYGHASYAGQVGVMLFNYQTGEMAADLNKLLALPFGSLHLPENAEKDHEITFDQGGFFLNISVKNGERHIRFSAKGFTADVLLKPTTPHSLVIQIPFQEYETAFYYNQKINCMTASGTAVYEGKTYTFDEADSYGLLDWGRGVWPFHNEWYWSNAAGKLGDGSVLGFNFGTGFGDTSHATENMLFYENDWHKIGRLSFTMDREDFMKPWHLRDEEGKVDLTLTPTFDRTTKTKVLFIDNVTHQMFGSFSGTVTLKDGRKLRVEDIRGFAEYAVNNW